MGRLTALTKKGHHRVMLYLILFCLFVFFVAWYIIKRRWINLTRNNYIIYLTIKKSNCKSILSILIQFSCLVSSIKLFCFVLIHSPWVATLPGSKSSVFLGVNQFLMTSFTVKIVSEHIMTLPCCLVMTTFQVVFFTENVNNKMINLIVII